ncbi:MAG: hypothetical protein LBT99_00645 [Bifidobacteriaceae bacterium]|jgi:RsiW-degrading membrane proteinase PrsW (M82 family)|nr:hypothetical protein [Bifidobacteriaceae bacterium]
MSLTKTLSILFKERKSNQFLTSMRPNLGKFLTIITVVWLVVLIVVYILRNMGLPLDIFVRICLCGVFVGLFLCFWEKASRYSRQKTNKSNENS